MTGHPQSGAISSIAATFLLLLAVLACKREHYETPEEKTARVQQENKEAERAAKVLQTLASLGDKVKNAGAPPAMKSGVLQHLPSGYANFDVLLADELSDPNQFAKIRILSKQAFGECAAHVKAKAAYPSDCTTPYVVVLKTTTYRTAVVADNTFTPGKVDATAYVFDMSNGELIGGGRVVAKTPDSITTKSSTAETELNDKLGTAAFESLAESLNVKTTN